MLEEQLLARQRQQKTLARAHLHASILGAKQRIHVQKCNEVQHCRQERQSMAQQVSVREGGKEGVGGRDNAVYIYLLIYVRMYVYMYMYISKCVCVCVCVCHEVQRCQQGRQNMAKQVCV